MMNNTEYLILWLDLETTGVPLEEPWDLTGNEPAILEVGAILTDWNLTPVGTEFHALIAPPPNFLGSRLPDAVREMHVESGLLMDVSPESQYPRYLHTDTVDEHLAMHINDVCSDYDFDVTRIEQPYRVMLAGSGVSHYDSRWIKHFLPLTWNCLKGYDNETKPTLDLGVIRRFLTVAGLPHLIAPDFSPAHSLTPHRALDDVKNFIAQAQWYRDTLEAISTDANSWRDYTKSVFRGKDLKDL